MAKDDPQEPFAEDQAMWEELNQCVDEETEDPFGHLQHNLDKDLTTFSSTSEHSLPSVTDSCTAACSTVLQQQQPVPLACFPGQRL